MQTKQKFLARPATMIHQITWTVLQTFLLVLVAQVTLAVAKEQTLLVRRRFDEAQVQSPPRLTHKLPNLHLLPGGTENVDCPVEGQPMPEVRWFKEGRPLVAQPAHLEQMGVDLMFVQLSEADSGHYHCQATNPLGTVRSQPFLLLVLSPTIEDPSIQVEPGPTNLVPLGQRPSFVCSIQSSKQAISSARLAWRRNGRPLLVHGGPELPEESGAEARVRQLAPNRWELDLVPMRPEDHNSSLTCLIQPDSEQSNEPARESASVRILIAGQASPEHTGQHPVPLGQDVHLGTPIDQLDQLMQPDITKPTGMLGLGSSQPRPQQDQPGRPKLNLDELAQLAKPGFMALALLFLVGLALLLQLAYFRRRARQHRYTKHQYLSGSGSGSSSHTSASLGQPISGCNGVDPLLSGLMSRTLAGAGPSAVSLGAAGKKFRSYRDQMRKAAAVHQQQQPQPGQEDLVDGYLAAVAAAEQDPNNPFSAVLPNLYNQSLAAREQARALLQSAGHMRSLSNLSQINKQQQHQHQQQQQHQQQLLMAAQNGSHLNLPLSFAFSQQQQQSVQQRQGPTSTEPHLLEGPLGGPQTGSAIWSTHASQAGLRATNRPDEHYQLLNCTSSISPSSTSSMGYNSNSSVGQTSGHQRLPSNGNNQDSSSLNHYSTIEAPEEEPQAQTSRCEDQNNRRPSVKRHTSVSSGHTHRQAAHQQDRTSTFLGPNSTETFQEQRAHRASLIISTSNHSASSSSGCCTDTTNTSSTTGNSKRSPSAFLHNSASSSSSAGLKSRQTNVALVGQHDQLSPYAVSSICSSVPPPPPVTSEAMRALNEQFDINQLMLLDDMTKSIKEQSQLPFNASIPPPPPPPSLPSASSPTSSKQTNNNAASRSKFSETKQDVTAAKRKLK